MAHRLGGEKETAFIHFWDDYVLRRRGVFALTVSAPRAIQDAVQGLHTCRQIGTLQYALDYYFAYCMAYIARHGIEVPYDYCFVKVGSQNLFECTPQ